MHNPDVLCFLTLLVAEILVLLFAATSCFPCFKVIVSLIITLPSDTLFITILRLLNSRM